MELDPGHCLRVRPLRVVCALWRSRSFMVFLLAVCASECLAVLSSVILRRVCADINLVYFVPSPQRTALLWTSRTLRLSLLGNATSWSGTFLKKGTEWYFGCSDGVFCAVGLKAFAGRHWVPVWPSMDCLVGVHLGLHDLMPSTGLQPARWRFIGVTCSFCILQLPSQLLLSVRIQVSFGARHW